MIIRSLGDGVSFYFWIKAHLWLLSLMDGVCCDNPAFLLEERDEVRINRCFLQSCFLQRNDMDALISRSSQSA